MVKKSFKITNETGIHARPATTLVNCCMEFDSKITLQALKTEVDFKSIMGVMSLGIYSGAHTSTCPRAFHCELPWTQAVLTAKP